MKNVIFYVTALLCLFVSNAFAQQTFEDRAKIIAEKIESITLEEKSALKDEVAEVNKQLENGAINNEQADQQKLELAQTRAANIERRTAAAQDELRKLVQDRVDGLVQTADTTITHRGFSITYKNDKVKGKKGKDTIPHSESRTTTQFVFAFGLNHLLTDGAMAHSDYRVWGSHFYEWGMTGNTRLLKNHNLLHLKYGLSLQYNNLRPTEDRFFVKEGNQTNLVHPGINLTENRLRNVNLVLPLHLEFDLTPVKTYGDKKVFKTHDNLRIGIGGYAGGNIKTKQILKYEDEAGNRVKERIKGSYNVNDFIYGLSAYVGYGGISLYAKYDLQPIFEDNLVDQNNISFGVRFDIN